MDYVLVAALFAVAIPLLVRAWRCDRSRILYGSLPVLAGVAYIGASLFFYGCCGEALAMVIFNIYMFALGLFTIMAGIRNGHLGALNGGMAILIAVIVARFFDCDFSFVARGVAFIIIGIGFLVVNLLMVRKNKGGAQ